VSQVGRPPQVPAIPGDFLEFGQILDFCPDVRWTSDPYLDPVGGHRFGRKANMNTRAITVLSLVGVLTAGSAAAMVNTRVLSKESSPTPAASVLSVTGIPTAPAVAGDPSASSLPTANPVASNAPVAANATPLRTLSVATAAPVTIAAQSTASSPVTARRLSAFQIGAAGLVRVDSGSSDFRIAEVVPGDGWTVVSYTTGTTAGTAQVVLRSGNVEVTFVAELVGGNIVTRVESQSISSGGSGSSSTDDDDDHEDEDHDDDHDEDDDHDDHDDEDHEEGDDDDD